MSAGRTEGRMKTGEFATRMGTQRARSRTPSVEIIAAVSPGAWHEGRLSRVRQLLIVLGRVTNPSPVNNRPHRDHQRPFDPIGHRDALRIPGLSRYGIDRLARKTPVVFVFRSRFRFR